MPTDEHRDLHPETLLDAVKYNSHDKLLKAIIAYLVDNAERLGVPVCER